MSYKDVPTIPFDLSSSLNKRPKFGPRHLADSRPLIPLLYENSDAGTMLRRKERNIYPSTEMAPLKGPLDVDWPSSSRLDTEEEARMIEGDFQVQTAREFV